MQAVLLNNMQRWLQALRDPSSFALPVVGAITIVLVVLLLLSTQWIGSEEAVIKSPPHIQARLVQIDKPKVKKVIKKQKKVIKKKAVVKKKAPVKTIKVNKKADTTKVVPVKKAKEKAKPLPLPGADLSKALEEEAAQSQLSDLLEAELSAQQADKEEAAIASYISQIQQLIQAVWRFPPSAQHEQVVLLRIFMVPTGEVTEVQIVESSGNTALDRSAEQAVWKVGRFPVPEDAILFEKQFRKLLIKLRPENARL